MTAIVETARAKINLTLRVLGRRPDGYHALSSLVAFADCGDRLTYTPGGAASLSVRGPFAGAITGSNLVATAVRLIDEAFAEVAPAAVTLEKHLPVAAGIGGGSADAAALLRAVRACYPGLADEPAWADLARRLGADVPVCVLNRAAFMSGIGESLVPVEPPLPPLAAVLVNPMAAVPADKTAQVFRALGAGPVAADAAATVTPRIGDRAELMALIRETGNDLSAPATRVVPAIGDVLAALRGCRGIEAAQLSGAGPTCFGVFPDPGAARSAAAALAAQRPDWWVQPALLS